MSATRVQETSKSPWTVERYYGGEHGYQIGYRVVRLDERGVKEYGALYRCDHRNRGSFKLAYAAACKDAGIEFVP